MCDNNNCDSIVSVDLFDQFQDCLGCLRIQCTGRLITEKDLRITCQYSGDRHPLLLASGKLGRIRKSLLLKSYNPKIFQSLFAGFRFPDPGNLHRKTDII